jgi:hypothetical protein
VILRRGPKNVTILHIFSPVNDIWTDETNPLLWLEMASREVASALFASPIAISLIFV